MLYKEKDLKNVKELVIPSEKRPLNNLKQI